VFGEGRFDRISVDHVGIAIHDLLPRDATTLAPASLNMRFGHTGGRSSPASRLGPRKVAYQAALLSGWLRLEQRAPGRAARPRWPPMEISQLVLFPEASDYRPEFSLCSRQPTIAG